jgi:hypothetical protein
MDGPDRKQFIQLNIFGYYLKVALGTRKEAAVT